MRGLFLVVAIVLVAVAGTLTLVKPSALPKSLQPIASKINAKLGAKKTHTENTHGKSRIIDGNFNNGKFDAKTQDSGGNLIFIKMETGKSKDEKKLDEPIDFTDPIAGMRAEAERNQQKMAEAKRKRLEEHMSF